MNTLVKTAVAGALALGGTSAFAIGLPSTNSSDLILYVDALTSSGSSAGVYALDTGITLSSLMPGGFTAGASNSTQFSGISKTIPESSVLSTFLSTYSSDTIEWTLEGGQYNGLSTSARQSNSAAPGSALAIFTSPILTNGLPKASTATVTPFDSYLNGLQNDIANGGLTALLSSKETGSATDTTVSSGAQSKYNFFGASDLASTGSAITLFGFTGNNSGPLQSYILGSATLSSSGVLSINPNGSTAPVPLPAAVWLFGSGVMGLVGVSRRRKAKAT
jgi:hypothetical protein